MGTRDPNGDSVASSARRAIPAKTHPRQARLGPDQRLLICSALSSQNTKTDPIANNQQNKDTVHLRAQGGGAVFFALMEYQFSW